MQRGQNFLHDNKSEIQKDSKIISVNTPYDDVFRTMLNDCIRLVIPVVNEVFGKNYDGSEEIILHHNEHFIHNKSGNDEKRITDSFFTIAGDKYMLECQSTADNSMIVRIFEYAVHAALDTAEASANDILEITIPNIAVLYLRSDSNTPDKMKILIHTPDGDFQFHAPVMKIKDYTLDSLFDKKLYFLLPFFAFNHENDFKYYDSDPLKLEELKLEYLNIINKLEQAKSRGELYQIDVGSIITMSRKVLDNLAGKYKNVKKGVDSIMGGQILEYEHKTIFNEGKREGMLEGHKEGIDQTNKRVAADMLRENMPIAMIAKISRLSEDVVRGIAESIGAVIVN